MALRSRKSDRSSRLGPPMRAPSASRAEREWRACAAATARAWSEWRDATGLARERAFVAYVAALEREERAAIALERTLRT
jgi:hypothetical protein